MKKLILLCSAIMFSFSTNAEEYFRQKWFDYPDPTTLPKTTVECVKEASTDFLCPTWSNPTRTCRKSMCIGHAYTVELLRIEPTFVVSGPTSPDSATKDAVKAIVAGCSATAINAINTAVAATPSPEPSARIGVGLAAGVTSFKTCIITINTTSVVSGILGLLEFKIDTPSHWARI